MLQHAGDERHASTSVTHLHPAAAAAAAAALSNTRPAS